jgi:hypothetical protein
MTHLLGKEASLQHARDERAALEAIFEALTEDEPCAPVLDSGRSPKDVLAHITAWEHRAVTAIATGRSGKTPPWPEPGFNPWGTHKLNERDFVANRDRPLHAIRAEAAATHDEFLSMAESFSQDEFAHDLPHTPGIKLEQIIRGHADEHDREHREAIETWRSTVQP